MYSLMLTDQDMDAILFAGNRYQWSTALLDHCDIGQNNLPEHVAWAIKDSLFADDGFCPLLSYGSSLAGKLLQLFEEVV